MNEEEEERRRLQSGLIFWKTVAIIGILLLLGIIAELKGCLPHDWLQGGH
jgi:hypothetical protein